MDMRFGFGFGFGVVLLWILASASVDEGGSVVRELVYAYASREASKALYDGVRGGRVGAMAVLGGAVAGSPFVGVGCG